MMIHINSTTGGPGRMENIFYTLQDFLTHTKGVSYIIIVLTLIGMLMFWKFLTARDDE